MRNKIKRASKRYQLPKLPLPSAETNESSSLRKNGKEEKKEGKPGRKQSRSIRKRTQHVRGSFQPRSRRRKRDDVWRGAEGKAGNSWQTKVARRLFRRYRRRRRRRRRLDTERGLVVNEQSFEPNMLSPRSGAHIQPVKVRCTCVRVASRHARRANRDKLSNWHRPSGTLPPSAPANPRILNMLLYHRHRFIWMPATGIDRPTTAGVWASRPRNFLPLSDIPKVQRCTCTQSISCRDLSFPRSKSHLPLRGYGDGRRTTFALDTVALDYLFDCSLRGSRDSRLLNGGFGEIVRVFIDSGARCRVYLEGILTKFVTLFAGEIFEIRGIIVHATLETSCTWQ